MPGKTLPTKEGAARALKAWGEYTRALRKLELAFLPFGILKWRERCGYVRAVLAEVLEEEVLVAIVRAQQGSDE